MFIEIHLALFVDWGWSNMFAPDPQKFTWIEKIIRPILVYAALVFLLRLFGKRELGQLNPFDLVVLLSLSNTVQNAIIGDDTSLSGGIVGAIALLGINYAMARFKYHSRWFESFIEGKPRVLIENSKINKKAVKAELLTREDLNTLAHREGFDSADDIKKCLLDPNGSFLVAGNTPTSDENFRTEVLKKLEDLTRQMSELKERLELNYDNKS